ncbi:MAG: GlmU family protein [Bacteroidales bacterium]|nr:GlmU family protein [Bacteroidales bacterium]
MNYILFDDSRHESLLPLTFLRPVADIRIGILTIREKWEKYLGSKTSTLTEGYLSKKFPAVVKEENNILINGGALPDKDLVSSIHKLKPNQALVNEHCIIAMHLTANEIENVDGVEHEEIEYTNEHVCLHHTWDIFAKNEAALLADFELLTNGRRSAKVDSTNTLIGKENIFIEEGARIQCAVLNGTTGPIYIGKDTEVMEGSHIRGPMALCDHSTVKMGAKIYGATTIGPFSKIGGEVSNVVIFGYSNKAHDGYLGNSVIAEWCNLGAGTNNSNLKNNYDLVKMWNYTHQSFVETGLQFSGLIMGDHSKTGISTMFNTGTVVGVNSNIYGQGFQRNFIPSFVWGSTSGYKNFDLNLALDIAARVMERRGRELDQHEKQIMKNVFDRSFTNRRVY